MGTQLEVSSPHPGTVLAKATLRAAGFLGLTDAQLAQVLSLSPSSLSRVRAGARPIRPEDKEGELALVFLRMRRSLASLVGDRASCEKWFTAENRHLGGVPVELVRTVEGLVHVTEYLDAMRGKS